MTPHPIIELEDVLLSEARNLGMRLAPELTAAPLYVLHARTLPTLPRPVDTLAYVAWCLQPLRQQLEQDGHWRGPGPAIVFVADGQPREQHLATLIHEVAHVLPHTPIADVAPTQENCAAEMAAIEVWARSEPAHDRPRWAPHHDIQWHRRLFHLWWRLCLLDRIALPLGGLTGHQYDLSSAAFYWQALGSEPLRMAEATFAEIEATPLPAGFEAAWYRDLEIWMQAHPGAVNTWSAK
ncbi:MAG: hypothetical protein K8T91_21415 [Planctomycetes bacterium]|nr:hypothetical protein [Planctomycetota bacterium]